MTTRGINLKLLNFQANFTHFTLVKLKLQARLKQIILLKLQN